MAVNRPSKPSPMTLLLLLLAAIHVSNAQIKCNIDTLNRYFLSGLPYSLSSNMKICPTVQETCCSITDEISIHELWRMRTKQSLDRHRDKVIDGLYQTLELYNEMIKFDPMMIITKYRVARQLNYTMSNCRSKLRQINAKDIQDVQNYYFYASQVRVQNKTRPNPFFNTWMSRNPAHVGWNLANYGFNFNKTFSPNTGQEYISPPNTQPWQVNGVQNPNLLWTQPNWQSMMGPNMEKQPLPQTPLWDQSHLMSNEGPRIWSDPYRPGRRMLRHNRKTAATKHSPKWEKPQTPHPKSNHYTHHPKPSKKSKSKRHPSYRKAHTSHRRPKHHAQTTNERNLQIVPPSRRASTIYNYQTTCFSQNSTFTRSFTIVNYHKSNYCFGIYKRFLNFDIDLFTNFIPAVKISITDIQNTKKSLYCSLCDAAQQSNFNYQNLTMAFEPNFCVKMLQNHIDYFRFMNVVFVQFMSQMLQYIQCFETDARVFQYPFENFMQRLTRRATFWNSCFNSLRNNTNATTPECWSICNKMSIVGISPLIEGDVALIEKVTAVLFSFVRKFEVESLRARSNATISNSTTQWADQVFNVRNTENVDTFGIEPLGPADFITNKTFLPDRRSGVEFFGRDPNTGYRTKDQMQMAVNELLRVAKLGNIDTLRRFGITTLSFFQQPISVNQNILQNEDRMQSSINRMVNRLYRLKTLNMTAPHEFPERYLRNRILRVIKDSGVNPKHYQRALHSYQWVGANTTFNGTWIVDKNITLSKTNLSEIKSFGVPYINPLNLTIAMQRAAAENDQEEEFSEGENTIYEPIAVGMSLENFAYVEVTGGINPAIYTNTSRFNFNVSRMIRDQYRGSEPIKPEVIRLYVIAQSKGINSFNEIGDQEIMSLEDLRSTFPQSLKMEKIMLVKFFAMISDDDMNEFMLPKGQPSNTTMFLLGLLEKNYTTDMMVKSLQDYRTAKLKNKETPEGRNKTFASTGMRGHSLFERFVDSVRDLFLGLFGSESGYEANPKDSTQALEYRKLTLREPHGALMGRMLDGESEPEFKTGKSGTTL